MYHVKWKDTWVNGNQLESQPDLVRSFERDQQEGPKVHNSKANNRKAVSALRSGKNQKPTQTHHINK